MADPRWLKDLQGNVRGAIKELGRLRKQNKSLKTQLDKAKAKLQGLETAEPAPDPEAEAWRAERKEVRRRAARLSKTLEELV